MLSNTKLSIVIPVYGVEGYIVSFTNSLFPQMQQGVQLIFINDGCQDHSITYLEQEIMRVPVALRENIQVIHQDNQGVSAARNTGLKLVKGDYTTFLDPDDTVVEHYLIDILKAIDEHAFDIMHFNFMEECKEREKKYVSYVEETQLTLSTEDTLNKTFAKNHWFPWARVIKSTLIKNFEFPVGFIYEDLLSFPFIYQENLRFYEYHQALINYQYRADSLTHRAIDINKLNSLKHGMDIYRDKHQVQYYRSTYIHIFELLFDDYLSLGFSEYCHFIHEHQTTDIAIMKKYLDEFHWKKRLMILFPKAFYFYKNRTKLFKKR